MAVSALEVQITQADRKVGLGRFTTTLERIAVSLREIDRLIVPRGTRPRWVVSDLRHFENVLRVQLTAQSHSQQRSLASFLEPVAAYVGGVQNLLEEPEVPEFYSQSTVSRLLRIGERTEGIHDVSLAVVNGKVGDPVGITEGVLSNARQAVREAEVSFGSIRGTLDILSRRGRGESLKINVLEASTRRAVNGWAGAEMGDALREAWGHRVMALGEITRNDRGQPVSIRVRQMERLPDTSDAMPPTEELLGIAPDWTNGLSVSEFLREARRA